MRPTFLARLVNGPLFDPVVYVRLLNLKSALLFDCGRFEGLSNREILSLDSVFISHLHMDHLMGFDHVLRVILHREKPLHVYGPEGVMEKIISRLMSYTWNLTQGYPLRIVIHEVQRHGVNTCTASAQNAFKPSPVSTAGRQGAAIASTPFSSMEAVVLDHNVPCLGFLLKEPFHINIQASRIAEKGYETGAWIGELKRLILEGRMGDVVEVPYTGGVMSKSVEALARDLVIISRGQKIAYITDIRASDENMAHIRETFKEVDVLFIEAYYLDERRRQAFEKGHLTAIQAGMIAKMLHAKKVVPMHISPRYHDQAGEILNELELSRNSS